MTNGKHWHLTPEQRQAISARMKGKPRKKPTFTPEQRAERARKISEANKRRYANMTPEEHEALKSKMRHKHNLTPEGFKKLSEIGKNNKGKNKKIKTQEKPTMAISNNQELTNYIDQLKRKLRLFASSFDQQPIENLPRIDAFLAKMMPVETQEQFLMTPVMPGNTAPAAQPQKRKYTRHTEGGAGLAKYKEPYRQYKAAGGTLKWGQWLGFAKTGNLPSPLNALPQSQQPSMQPVYSNTLVQK
jgi:hypothetical protein